MDATGRRAAAQKLAVAAGLALLYAVWPELWIGVTGSAAVVLGVGTRR